MKKITDFSQIIKLTTSALKTASKISAVHAREFYRSNIIERSGNLSSGLHKWTPRKKITKCQVGKKLLQISGRLQKSIHIISITDTSARIGVDSPDVIPYAYAHNYGVDATERVRAHTRQKKTKTGTKDVKIRAFSRHMKIPARPFIGASIELEREISDLLTAEMNKINQ